MQLQRQSPGSHGFGKRRIVIRTGAASAQAILRAVYIYRNIIYYPMRFVNGKGDKTLRFFEFLQEFSKKYAKKCDFGYEHKRA